MIMPRWKTAFHTPGRLRIYQNTGDFNILWPPYSGDMISNTAHWARLWIFKASHFYNGWWLPGPMLYDAPMIFTTGRTVTVDDYEYWVVEDNSTFMWLKYLRYQNQKNFQAMYLVHDRQSEMLIKLNLLPDHCSGEYRGYLILEDWIDIFCITSRRWKYGLIFPILDRTLEEPIKTILAIGT